MFKSRHLKALTFLSLSTALSLPSVSLAGIEVENLSDEAISKLGVLSQLPKELIKHIGKDIGTEHSDIIIAMSNTTLFTAMIGCTTEDFSKPAFPQQYFQSDIKVEDEGVFSLFLFPKDFIVPFFEDIGIKRSGLKTTRDNTALFTAMTKRTTKVFRTPVFPQPTPGSASETQQEGLPLQTVTKSEKKYFQYTELVNFNKLSEEQILGMPAYIWKGVVRTVENLPQTYWPFLPGTNVKTVNLAGNGIKDVGARDLVKNLQGTNVKKIDLSRNRIQPDGARSLAKNLKGTNVKMVNLSLNNINAETQAYLIKTHSHIEWIF